MDAINNSDAMYKFKSATAKLYVNSVCFSSNGFRLCEKWEMEPCQLVQLNGKKHWLWQESRGKKSEEKNKEIKSKKRGHLIYFRIIFGPIHTINK